MLQTQRTIGTKQAAEQLGISVATLTRWVQLDDPPIRPVGRLGTHRLAPLIFNAEEVEALAKELTKDKS